MLTMLSQASIFALLSLVVAVVPLVMGLVYAVRPSESRLALMRPLSLAGLFSGLGGLMAGLINVLRGLGEAGAPTTFHIAAVGLSEALVSLFVAFGCLTVGWLCVAFGMTRDSAHR
jgi:hypothetical protein